MEDLDPPAAAFVVIVLGQVDLAQAPGAFLLPGFRAARLSGWRLLGSQAGGWGRSNKELCWSLLQFGLRQKK